MEVAPRQRPRLEFINWSHAPLPKGLAWKGPFVSWWKFCQVISIESFFQLFGTQLSSAKKVKVQSSSYYDSEIEIQSAYSAYSVEEAVS